jgi:hypothetical protein
MVSFVSAMLRAKDHIVATVPHPTKDYQEAIIPHTPSGRGLSAVVAPSYVIIRASTGSRGSSRAFDEKMCS